MTFDRSRWIPQREPPEVLDAKRHPLVKEHPVRWDKLTRRQREQVAAYWRFLRRPLRQLEAADQLRAWAKCRSTAGSYELPERRSCPFGANAAGKATDSK